MSTSRTDFQSKKFTLAVLALMLAFTLAGCGEEPTSVSNVTSATTAPAATSTTTTSAATTTQSKTTTVGATVAVPTTTQKTAGTTSTATGAATGNTTDWCNLLTKDEAQAILEEPASEPTRRDIGPSSSCTYKPVNTAKLNFIIITYFNRDYTQADFISTEKQVADALTVPAKTVDGVGDKANSFDRRLDVLKGGKYFVVQVTSSGLSVDQSLEKARAVALKVVQKL